MHIMIDNTGTTQYTDPAWFQVYSNRERKRLKIIKDLIEVVNNLISLDKLNLFTVIYEPNYIQTNDNILVEIQNNDKKSSEITIVSVEDEWR